jgi:hypothetical protein
MNDSLRTFDAGKGFYYSLPALEQKGLGKISRLLVSIRIVLESVLPNLRWQEGCGEGARLMLLKLAPELRSQLAQRRFKPTAGSVYHFSST